MSAIIKENEFKNSTCFWISPSGRLISSYNTHIGVVIKEPKTFGLTIDKIKDVYDKYNERMGIEGNARLDIIKNLVLKGWMRIRYYERQGRWTINVARLTKHAKDYIQNFAKNVIDAHVDKYSIVYIDTITSSPKRQYTMADLAKDILYLENKKMKKSEIKRMIREELLREDKERDKFLKDLYIAYKKTLPKISIIAKKEIESVVKKYPEFAEENLGEAIYEMTDKYNVEDTELWAAWFPG